MEETVRLTIVTATSVNVPRESGAKTVPKVSINLNFLTSVIQLFSIRALFNLV